MARRLSCLVAALSGAALIVGCSTTGSDRSGDAMTVSQAAQSAMTPQQAIADLKSGNDRFVRGETINRDWQAQAKATAGGQFPKAIVLSCLDSRVPVEVVFDQGIGDIFVGRVAGNFENTDMLGSMEFGTKLAGSKAIVVLGHSSCGAVKGAMAGAELGNLTETLANIKPAVDSAARGGALDASDPADVAAVVEANVRQTVGDIKSRSPVIAELVASGELTVVGAVYDLESGRVTWLDS